MSYDLVVWVGERPEDAEQADELYEQLMEQLEEQLDDGAPPLNPRLVAYAEDLTARWPDDEELRGPWVLWPLIGDGVGDILPFGVGFEHAEAVAPYAAELASKHGLVCYDPQEGALRPWPAVRPRPRNSLLTASTLGRSGSRSPTNDPWLPRRLRSGASTGGSTYW